ncbi:hypothetical protein DES53_11686 [Roseimicrobium gellanilyticum]|uniref:Outer membrane protein OmpA-like peptidoglycan-associated protein n=1 Tax=Roseimicrobium gellanilyticum TaxID=748857 RepID=A0A366H6S7_9BACT|nr:hypothetical protein [Roseimicrobium gellanilyticum]RBP36647.1 hypothetical protein DES53_11686 [Roseimicrobium gellanilyticum]
MSAEPKSSDSLHQLKELMLGDELRDIAAFRQRLDSLDASSLERLSKDLAAALKQRKERGGKSFEELVAALQPGTESAIQRSISEDKSKLSNALFPIMGPAIRSYVVDLFRGMVKDLNETIRNTTSAERLKWRLQAKLAGKPYSEYVLLKTRSFRIDEVYLMQRDTGLLLLHVARNPVDEAGDEADLVSGMFTAIRSFVKDSFGKPGTEGDEDASELDGFVFGDREVLIEAGPSLVLAAVVHGVPPASVREQLKALLEELHARLGGKLENFSGNTAELEPERPILRRALVENRAESSESGGGGGGMWRAWLFLGLVAAGVTAWLVASAREQAKWDRYEDALRASPGVAITSVEKRGWWKTHRTMRGLRDPLAAEPSEKFAGYGIDPATVKLDFALMTSMDPAFAKVREERLEEERRKVGASLEKLQADLGTAAASATADGKALSGRLEEDKARTRLLVETLFRSLMADAKGLSITFSEAGDAVTLRGALSVADLAKVKARIEPLSRWLKVDASGLGNASAAELERLRSALDAAAVEYFEGTLQVVDQKKRDELRALVVDVDRVGRELGHEFSFEVIAHPLIGANRDANREVEHQRTQQVRDLLREAGIQESRMALKLSEDLGRSGAGITVRAIEVQGNTKEVKSQR